MAPANPPVGRWAMALFALVLALGLGGLIAAAFSVATGIGAVEIGPGRGKEFRLLGLHLTHPWANGPAIVLIALALTGLLALGFGLRALARRVGAQRRLAHAMGRLEVARRGEVAIFDHPQPQAFCAGLARPRVYVSTGAMRVLGPRELELVLAHEDCHRARRDPLRALIACTLADALFFLPVMARLRDRCLALAELAADDAAVATAGGDPGPLASALLAFDEPDAPLGAVGIAPERVDRLLGVAPALALPALPLAAAALTVAGMLVIACEAGQRAVVHTTLALPGLSQKPCVLVLASVPLALGAFGLVWMRRRALRR